MKRLGGKNKVALVLTNGLQLVVLAHILTNWQHRKIFYSIHFLLSSFRNHLFQNSLYF